MTNDTAIDTDNGYEDMAGASFEGGWGPSPPKEKEKKKKKRKKEERKKEGNYE